MFLRADKDTLESLVNARFVSPGPTYYQERSVFAPKNRIVTGSLIGPKQIKEDLGFGTATRFQQTQSTTPGPSHYNTIDPKEKAPAKAIIPVKLPKPKGMVSCPSIPHARNRIGQVLEGRAEQPQQETDGKGITLTTRAPAAYTFPKSEYPSRQPIQVEEDLLITADLTRQETVNEMKWTSNKHPGEEMLKRQDLELEKMRQENNRRKRELLDLVLNNNTIPSLEVLQMRKKFQAAEVPGPGFYQFNTNTVEVKNSAHMFTGFASNTQRFLLKDEFPKQGPGRYTVQPVDKKPTVFSFGRQKKQIAEPVRREWTANSESINVRGGRLVRQNSEPFGSGSTRFNSEPRLRLPPEPSKPFPKKMHPNALRKLRKSISTSQTMESQPGSLQSVDVLFHMYGNN